MSSSPEPSVERSFRPSLDMGVVAYRMTVDRAELTATLTDPTAGLPFSNDAQVDQTLRFINSILLSYYISGNLY